MPRPKGSTNKTKIDTMNDPILNEQNQGVQTIKKKIDPCGLKLNSEEMNLLVDKLNEVINYINGK